MTAKPPELSTILGQTLGCDIVNVLVGPEATAKKFAVHKAILSSKSLVFNKMFDGDFREGVTQSASLPEDKPGTFEMFLNWLYRDKIEWAGPLQGQLMDLLYFADKYQIIVLMDKSMDALILQYKAYGLLPSPYRLSDIYCNTATGSKVRLFAARTFAWLSLSKGGDDKTWGNRPMEKAAKEQEDLWHDAYALMRKTSGLKFPDPHQAHACDYHQHRKDQTCPYTSLLGS